MTDPRKTERWKRLARAVSVAARRDGATCHLCGWPITASQPLEVDHVVPIDVDPSRAFDRSNLAPAHRSCNRRGGAQITNAKRRPIVKRWSGGFCQETGEENLLQTTQRWFGGVGDCLFKSGVQCPASCDCRGEVDRRDAVPDPDDAA